MLRYAAVASYLGTTIGDVKELTQAELAAVEAAIEEAERRRA